MSNIATCHGEDCEKRDTCLRYTTAPSIPPRWSSFDVNTPASGCDGYWPLRAAKGKS